MKRYSPRRGAGSAAQDACALIAASKAARMSSGPEAWNKPTVSEVSAGLTFEKFFFEMHSTHWPPI